MKRVWQGLVALGGLLLASTVGAQVVDGRGNPYRQWDVAVSSAVHFDRERSGIGDTVFDHDDWDGGAAVQVDAGRYWNSHVKTEVSFAALTGRNEYQTQRVPVPGGFGDAYHRIETARTQIGAALTYQFFENVFAHPYVSAGVRATLHDSHTVRERSVYYRGPSGYTSLQIPPFESHDRDVFARPYVAAGFKSYFNERTFIRSELSTAYAESGISQWTLRIGFGLDF